MTTYTVTLTLTTTDSPYVLTEWIGDAVLRNLEEGETLDALAVEVAP